MICWKLTKILILLLIKAEKFYRCLYSGRGTIQQKAVILVGTLRNYIVSRLRPTSFKLGSLTNLKAFFPVVSTDFLLVFLVKSWKNRKMIYWTQNLGRELTNCPSPSYLDFFLFYDFLFWDVVSETGKVMKRVRMNGKSENKVTLLIFQLLLTFNYGQTIL